MTLLFTDFRLILSRKVDLLFVCFDFFIIAVGGTLLCPVNSIFLNFKNGVIGKSFVKISAT
jgi:hypothetical protein